MTTDLLALRDAGVLSPLDVQLAQTLERLAPGQPPCVLLGAAFASRAVTQGHVCADLRSLIGRPLVSERGEPVSVTLPSIFEWVIQLGASPLCGDGLAMTPLVFDGEARLYLRRYWTYQNEVAADLRMRSLAGVTPWDAETRRDIASRLDRLFGGSHGQAADPRQKLAAVAAARHHLAVISGGPGTGKTTTVVRVLALLIEQALARGESPPRIDLLAPTGKAAAKLIESIRDGASRLACDPAVHDAIPDQAATIHRRLGMRPGRPTQFFHDRSNPLPADVVLVDEASMIDLALLAKLLQAVPRRARLILLGDKDQLASVEAGAILGDICNVDGHRAYSAPFAAEVASVLGRDVADGLDASRTHHGIWDCVVELTRSFRFDAEGGIGRLARAINAGDGEEAVRCVESTADPHVRLIPLHRADALPATLAPLVLPAFEPLFTLPDPEARLAQLGTFRLLAAHRRGPFGTEALNRLIEELLRRQGFIRGTSSDGFYDGRPVMVTQNDYQLELFNGDIGILQRDAHGDLRAYFATASGELRALLPARLPPHESVYAMTVHKSQGSEFRDVALLMPPELSPLMTRELVYTGVTRARTSVTLIGSAAVLREAAARRVDRASGLRDALWCETTQTFDPSPSGSSA